MKNGIIWRFILVESPRFGGLREAAVKSTNSQLKCIFDEANAVLTFEDFLAVLRQIYLEFKAYSSIT